MASKKIFVVFGATGNQGGSVINTFLSDPGLSKQFHLRGVTRDPSKDSAAALTLKGIEMIKGDIDDIESLKTVIKDAYAVFAVTNWQEVLDKDKEIAQGKRIADVAKELNVQHVIWSSLPNVTKITNGTNTGVLHFDSKAIIQEYMESISLPATYLQLGVFMHYTIFQLVPSSDPTKKQYTLQIPLPLTTSYPLINVNADTGKYVKSILLSRDTMLGRTILAGEREYSILEVVDILKRAGGLDVSAEQVSVETYRDLLGAKGFPEWLKDDMTSNMDFIEKWGLFGGEKVERDHSILTEPLVSFEEWAASSNVIAGMK